MSNQYGFPCKSCKHPNVFTEDDLDKQNDFVRCELCGKLHCLSSIFGKRLPKKFLKKIGFPMSGEHEV
jgi:uncharacterized Zn finger protein